MLYHFGIVTKPTGSTQPCIPPGSLNRVPALTGWSKGGNVTSAGWQVTLCDPIWHVSSYSREACLCTFTFTLPATPLLPVGPSPAACGGRTGARSRCVDPVQPWTWRRHCPPVTGSSAVLDRPCDLTSSPCQHPCLSPSTSTLTARCLSPSPGHQPVNYTEIIRYYRNETGASLSLL